MQHHLKFHKKFLPNRLELSCVCAAIAVNKCSDQAYETTQKCSRVATFFKCIFLVFPEAISNLVSISTVQNKGMCSLPPKFFSLHYDF